MACFFEQAASPYTQLNYNADRIRVLSQTAQNSQPIVLNAVVLDASRELSPRRFVQEDPEPTAAHLVVYLHLPVTHHLFEAENAHYS